MISDLNIRENVDTKRPLDEVIFSCDYFSRFSPGHVGNGNVERETRYYVRSHTEASHFDLLTTFASMAAISSPTTTEGLFCSFLSDIKDSWNTRGLDSNSSWRRPPPSPPGQPPAKYPLNSHKATLNNIFAGWHYSFFSPPRDPPRYLPPAEHEFAYGAAFGDNIKQTRGYWCVNVNECVSV